MLAPFRDNDSNLRFTLLDCSGGATNVPQVRDKPTTRTGSSVIAKKREAALVVAKVKKDRNESSSQNVSVECKLVGSVDNHPNAFCSKVRNEMHNYSRLDFAIKVQCYLVFFATISFSILIN
jgi:hypothetical protein